MHLLLLMSVNMLDFICTGFAWLWGTGREWQNQTENVRLQRDSNPSKFVALDHSATLTEMFKCAYNFALYTIDMDTNVTMGGFIWY